MPSAVVQVYYPLICTTPETTHQYLRLWGVPDIVTYFLFCPTNKVQTAG